MSNFSKWFSMATWRERLAATILFSLLIIILCSSCYLTFLNCHGNFIAAFFESIFGVMVCSFVGWAIAVILNKK